MARLIFIVGKSGSGKSTSERNLDPKTSMVINSDKKELPFKGGKNAFGANYIHTSNISEVIDGMKKANKDTNIKTLVIDTWSIHSFPTRRSSDLRV